MSNLYQIKNPKSHWRKGVLFVHGNLRDFSIGLILMRTLKGLNQDLCIKMILGAQ
jgi:hypothetical protein